MLPVVLSSNSTAEIKHFAHAHTSLCTATNMLLGDTTSGFFFFLMDTAKYFLNQLSGES